MCENRKYLKTLLDTVPKNPGVYLMKDASGSVIYVGKALNLKSRLGSYFTENPKVNVKTLSMICTIADFSYLICENETEALLLECNLIKEHLPKYNILLRDDKEYPYIKVTLNEEYPRVLKAFRIGKDIETGAKYYGPYTSGSLKYALETLKTLFPLKDCKKVFPRDIGKGRPCLNYYIGKCTGICRGGVDREEYRKTIYSICEFLDGKYDGILKDLKKTMDHYSKEHNFEKAALYRDRYMALEEIMIKQKVADVKMRKDIDVIGFFANNADNCIQKLEIRQGRLVGNATFFALGEGKDKEEILESILMQHYTGFQKIPPHIYLPFDIPQKELLSAALESVRKKKVSVSIPVRGYGKKLVEMANENAMQSLRRHSFTSSRNGEFAIHAVKLLSKILFDDRDHIKRIEAFDVSNYGQDDKCAAMAVFINARPEKSEYRLYKIKNMEEQDDYGSIRQAVQRRFSKLMEEEETRKPQFVLVDGGKGHVGAVMDVIRETGDGRIEVAGMVKDKRHKTKGLVFSDGEIIELNDGKDSKIMSADEKKDILRFVAGIQEEVHRFAISYTKKLSAKRNIKYSLEDIPGIGPARRRGLLKAFGSIRAIKNARITELEKADKMTQESAVKVFEHFNKKEK